MKKIFAISVISVILLSACGVSADRKEGGTKPDDYGDTTNVIVYRNVDNVPNVALFCTGSIAWASTLSSDGAKQPQLVRLPEWDENC